MTSTLPPVGALVRHTSTYTDGTVITMEGRVHSHSTRGEDPDHFFIGTELRTAYLAGHGFDVKLEVLETPLPPEPPAGSVVRDKDGDAWQREDSDGRRWAAAVFSEAVGMIRHDWASLNARYGPLTALVPDPAADAPTQVLLEAALAWVAYVKAAPNPPNVWGDGHDFALITAVEAYNAAREARQP